MIWIVHLVHLLYIRVLSEPDFLKTRYFFIFHGILENVVPSIIRNRKKVKSVLSSYLTFEIMCKSSVATSVSCVHVERKVANASIYDIKSQQLEAKT